MTLHIENVYKAFDSPGRKVTVLDNICIEIKRGEFICIVGESGCGKTTLLNLIAGLHRPTQGQLVFGGSVIDHPGPDRAIIFQDLGLFPWLSVVENVEFGMKIANVPKDKQREEALKYLDMVHLGDFSQYFVHELSGGMKQRVAIARALALKSDLLMMDEPFAALDAATKADLIYEIRRIWKDTGKTMIVVTHNVDEAISLADRIVVMTPRPGRIHSIFDVRQLRESQGEAYDTAVIKEQIHDILSVTEKEYTNET